MPLFTGRFEYSVDDKGRLSIPARLREQVEQEGQTQFIVTCLHSDFLSVLLPEEFRTLLDIMGKETDDRSRELLRLIASEAETCPLDKQGRIQVPPALRAKAGLGRDVVILGVVKRIEIWDRAREAVHRAQVAQDGARLLSNLKVPSDLI